MDFGESGPVRCSRCKGYVNPFMKFIDQGRRFVCNLCGEYNPCPSIFYPALWYSVAILVFFSFAVWLVTLFLLFDLSGGTTSCLRSFYTVAVRSSFDIYSRVEHCLDALFLVNNIDKFMVNTVLHPNTIASGRITQIYFEL